MPKRIADVDHEMQRSLRPPRGPALHGGGGSAALQGPRAIRMQLGARRGGRARASAAASRRAAADFPIDNRFWMI
jgi:hypothetical protein